MHIIHPFTTNYPYNHTYNTHSLKTEIYHFIHRKTKTESSHLILSCPDMSLFGKVVGNHLTVSHNIVGGTLLDGTSVPNVPARWDATKSFQLHMRISFPFLRAKGLRTSLSIMRTCSFLLSCT